MNNYKINEKNQSSLRLESLYVENMEFNRDSDIMAGREEVELNIAYTKNMNRIGDSTYEVGLGCLIHDAEGENRLRISVKMVGLFSFHGDESERLQEEGKNILLSKNTLAIMFPFLRSQITVLTSQPEMNPIILPAMNINELFSDEEMLRNE